MKVIFIDYSVYVHRAICAWRVSPTKQIPATFTALSMIFGSLMRVGLSPDDLVIFAVDSHKGNWRKEIDPAYKANRKGKREKFEDIDWPKQFAEFDELIVNLEQSTPFYFISAEKMEADDIIAYGVRHFDDKECIIISTDSDFEQLLAFPNVKLFSPVAKKYKHVKNPYKILAKKINKETTDNLITPILTTADYEKRKTIVNLMELPSFVEEAVAESLSLVQPKEYSIERLMFRTLIERYHKLFNSDKIVNPNAKKKSVRKKKSK